MAINRFDLIRAISTARIESDNESYDELLSIYYQLLEQEDINDVFIKEFTIYHKISEAAQKFLNNNLKCE